MTELKKSLSAEKVSAIYLTPCPTVEKDSSLKEALRVMRERKVSCVVITHQHKIAGIFTERDLLQRVMDKKLDLKVSVETLMTANPVILKAQDSVAQAIRLMNEGHYRHIPVIGTDGEVQGLVTARDIIDYLAAHFPHQIYNLPPDPRLSAQASEGA